MGSRLLTTLSTFILLLENSRVWSHIITPQVEPESSPFSIPTVIKAFAPPWDPYAQTFPPNFPNCGNFPIYPPPMPNYPPSIIFADEGRKSNWLNFLILLLALRKDGSDSGCGNGCSGSCGCGCDSNNWVPSGICTECGGGCNDGCGGGCDGGCATGNIVPYPTPVYEVPVQTSCGTTVVETCAGSPVTIINSSPGIEEIVATPYPTIQTIPGRNPNEVYLIIKTDCNN